MKIDKNINAKNAAWTFSGIEEDFEKHIRKSIPFYDHGHDVICSYSDFFLSKKNSLVYEIGCSSGALTDKILEWNKDKILRIVGLDNQKGMIKYCKKRFKDKRAEFIFDDATSFNFEKSNFIVSYYTLQFIHPSKRQNVFNKIYDSLEWGGGFIFFEKTRACDARFQDYQNQLYSDFKLKNGFKENEIVNKTRSLKGVLEPFSEKGNIGLLQRAGFVDFITIFKSICFQGYLAIK